jgi:UDP-N-acetylglucosamine 1-carboxyvinyltransferase
MKYIIQESKPLVGSVKISGAKNSALGLIAGALLTNETMVIKNVPHVSDIENLLNAINTIGGETSFSNNIVTLNSKNVNPNIVIDYEDIRKIRASYYLLGALLGKNKKAIVALPGGCQIGTRPIDLHLKGFRALGATTQLINGNIVVEAKELKGNIIYLDFPSVGATINIMLASVFAKGTTIIRNAAREPHIVDIANMLVGMGANIRGAGTTEIRIVGCEQLHGYEHTTIPDQIEAGTFMFAAAISNGDIVIEQIPHSHSPASKRSVGGGLEWGIFYIKKR